MESSNDKKKPGADHEAPPPERMTAEQIADDMKRYARQHRYHGELHALDDQEALRVWEQRRKEEVPVWFALERSDAVDEPPEEVHAVSLDPAGVRRKYCAAHPDSDSPWVCVDCGAHFCAQCVRPMMTFFNPAHGGYEHASAVCPSCKGRCVNRRFEAEKQHRIRGQGAAAEAEQGLPERRVRAPEPAVRARRDQVL